MFVESDILLRLATIRNIDFPWDLLGRCGLDAYGSG
jgi:hypothetical protein